MAFPIVGLVIATVLFVLYLRTKRGKSGSDFGKNLKQLPGPRGYPLVGNALQLGSVPNKQFNKWTKEYGDLFQVRLGGQK